MSKRAVLSLGAWLVLCLSVGGYFNHKYPTDPAGNLPTPTQSPVGNTVEKVPCYEDQPCWDCHTMGNRICGLSVGSSK